MINYSVTKNFIVLHFGLGTEQDFNAIKNFLIGFKTFNQDFFIDIYPGYPHGFLEFKESEDAVKLVDFLSSKNLDEDFEIKDGFKNMQKIDSDKIKLFKRNIELDFDGKPRNVFFFSTNLKKEQMNCGYQQTNSLESATRDYKKYEKIGLHVIENVMTENEE